MIIIFTKLKYITERGQIQYVKSQPAHMREQIGLRLTNDYPVLVGNMSDDPLFVVQYQLDTGGIRVALHLGLQVVANRFNHINLDEDLLAIHPVYFSREAILLVPHQLDGDILWLDLLFVGCVNTDRINDILFRKCYLFHAFSSCSFSRLVLK